MLVVLVAFAGVSVDVGNWYFVGNKAQKAADSAALSGAVFLPSNLSVGQTVALDTAKGNGFSSTQGDTVTAAQAARPNQMRVTITRPVKNFFLGLLGIGTTTLTRTAVAEFQGPVPMGSPDNRLGRDPETGYDPQFWINVAGPNATKVSGDRFTANTCGSTGQSSTVANCSGTNTEYEVRGYTFAVRVDAVSGSDPLNFQIYDPLFSYVGDNCTTSGITYPSAAEITAFQSLDDGTVGDPAPNGYYDTANVRYAAGQNAYCTGDQDIAGRDMVTTFIVRTPDDTPLNDYDNPIATDGSGNACTMQARAFDLQNAGIETGSRITKYLTPGDGFFSDAEAVVDNTDNFQSGGTGLTFAEGFRRWVSVCEVPNAQAQVGDYILQIKTSAPLGNPNGVDATNRGGHNRMAIRAGFASGINVPAGGSIGLFGNGKLPIYANDTGASSTFYVARILPSGGDRILTVTLYDIGDVQSGTTGTLTLLGPSGSAWSPPGGCTYTFRQDGSTSSSAGCQLTGVNSSIKFQGQLIEIAAPIPSSYTCDSSVRTDCWFKIVAAFPGGVTDTTTWQAQLLGDPVHLIE
jgi:hypothetical protein